MIEWNGRQMTLFSNTNGEVYNYIYNSDGIRTLKRHYDENAEYVGVTKYTLDGTKIVAENRLGVNIYYTYDDKGAIMGMIYGGESYVFAKNLQGDVIGIYDDDSVLVAKYEYSAFGEITAITNANGTDVSGNATHIANINPFRYRGYYYDTETELYYLITRYYDPVVGRFINSDNQLSTGGITGVNLFAYCGNNPINRIDPLGEAWWHWALGAAVVAVCAVATVVTCGGAATAAVAVASVANGVAAATTASTIAAGAFIGSATAYGMAVMTAASSSDTVEEFCDQGNWGTVVDTVVSGVVGAADGYIMSKVQQSDITDTQNNSQTVVGKGTQNPKVKAAVQKGQAMHKQMDYGPGVVKEQTIAPGCRVDGIDVVNHIIYELKPNNPQAIARGLKQLDRYLEAARQKYGGEWAGVLKLYD